MFARLLMTAVLFALSVSAQADLVFYAEPSSGPYCALFDDADDTKVDFTEGTGEKVGRFVVEDAAIETAGMAGGVYTARVFATDEASLDVSTAVLVGTVAKFRWSGTEEICASAYSVGGEYAQLAYAKLVEAAATPRPIVAALVDAARGLIAWSAPRLVT